MVLVSKTKRSHSIHHKRRHGQHHKQSPDYHRPYWPYLPLGLIIGLGILANSFWGVVQQAVLGYATSTTVSSLVEETNVQRANSSLTALALNEKLNQAAQAKANDMAARNYWSHNTPEGNPPWYFFSNAGYEYKAAGENLAYGFDSSNATVVAWMNSPGHRANIMNTTYTEIGFGIANVENYQDTGPQTIVVAMYGTQQVASANSSTHPSTTPAKPAPAPKPAQEKPAAQPATPTLTDDTVVSSNELLPEMAPSSQNVARIQLLADDIAPWAILTITVLATLAIMLVFLRHSLVWHRVLVKGERFILRHRFVDVALVLVGVIGFIVTRSAGSIH